MQKIGYDRQLKLTDVALMVIGGIIGAGIFFNPSVVAKRCEGPVITLATWALGGLVAVLGALSFAELGSRHPDAGGIYVYLRRGFGPLAGFLTGWTLFLVGGCGSIAAVASGSAKHLCRAMGWDLVLIPKIAMVMVVTLTVINCLRVRVGATTQNVLTVAKVSALIFVCFAGFWVTGNPILETAAPAAAATSTPLGVLWTIGLALGPVLFAYGGWQAANCVGAEIEDPRRNLPRGLILGIFGVLVLYLTTNVAYMRALGFDGLIANETPALAVAENGFGPTARWLVGMGIVLSTLGFLNITIMSMPRIYQAMAADGLFFEFLARIDPRTLVPINAILLQTCWVIVLLFSGQYDQLLDYVVFGDWLFMALATMALFVFRRTQVLSPEEDAALFKTPGYPLVPLLFILFALYGVIGAVASSPWNAACGAILILAGMPVYLIWSHAKA